ncbi:chemotaxis protein CheW [Bosea sp. TWI1241]|jgi:purine-binding chemotaxis protein CheW|uniref:chemotaxis protein CheW n=1 Tax=Bosea sp. TWI1241 TaxID=3148904 RepID=UPI0032079CC1
MMADGNGTGHDDSASAPVFEDSLDYVTVMVGEQRLGLPIGRVQDVFMASRITPVPLAPPQIVGLLNLRGRIVTAIGMRERLGRAAAMADGAEAGGERVAVGIEHGGESFALIVDSVGEVARLDRKSFEPVPIHLDRDWARLALGIHRLDGSLLVVLDIDAVLDIDLPTAA